MHKRSISTTIDIIHASDTDGEMEERDQMKATPIITPMMLRKPSNLALKKVKYKEIYCQAQLRLQLQLQFEADFALFSIYPPTNPPIYMALSSIRQTF